ncbi:unnamed protein product [Paramecium sonneborni]|uniref:Anoctamin transmembrane domain-containing protein n=1 Tax=Paramecium sonneborni TaxID=65129 RepID=A0A8S1R2S8_9CILI|nr:unnamed protein product [Paramecium sonneborni]
MESNNSVSRNSRASRQSLAEVLQAHQEQHEQELKSKLKKAQTLSSKKIRQQQIQTLKEQSLREILGFFTNQIDVKRFLKNKKKLLSSDDTEEAEKYQDEFLNPNEFQEMKHIYGDCNIGDVVIVFPNPDDEEAQVGEVTFMDAEKVFDKFITVITDEVSKSYLKKERDSFLLSYLTLGDYVKPEKKTKKQDEKKQKIENAQNNQNQIPNKDNDKDKDKDKDKEAQQNNNHIEQQQQAQSNINNNKPIDIEEVKLLQNLKDQPSKNNLQQSQQNSENDKIEQETSYQKYLKFMKLYSEQLKFEEEQYQLQRNESMQILGERFSEITFSQQFYRKWQKQKKQEDLIIDPLKELLKIDLNNIKQFKNISKQLSKGGYLVKKMNDEVDYDWICQNTPPKDFLTLVRITAINKLCRNAFVHCRQFVSTTGKHIFVVVKGHQQVITRQAQKMKITKQIEMGFADLFSLEPVDEQFRPLRLKSYVRIIDDDLRNLLAQEEQEQNKEPEFDYLNCQDVENYCLKLYIKVRQWKGKDLKYNVIKKQRDVDKILKEVVTDLNIDQSHEKVELIDDIQITDEEWQVYYLYLESILCFGKKIQWAKEQKMKEVIDNIAFLYKLVFLKALGDANQIWYAENQNFWREFNGDKRIIFNLWGRLNITPVAPYTEYFKSTGSAGSSLWRKYEINENKHRSEFINMEKIKITNSIILKHINILKMLQMQYIFAYFPIHDLHQLKGQGELKKQFFEPLKKNGFIIDKETSEGEKYLRDLFKELADEAESTDFDSESLEKESQFNYRVPWDIPIDSIRDYFGEKIALYFNFLNYYAKQLWYMAIISIVTQGIMSSSSLELRQTAIIGFSIVIIIWSTFFMEFWKREQVYFSVRFGQQNFEADEAERPAFEGDFIRSVLNDDLNEEFYSPFKRKMKQLLALSISAIIIGCVIACVIGINLLKNKMIEEKFDQTLSNTLPSILQAISINVFNVIYNTVGQSFNVLENHKILSTYENSLVAKFTIFRFVNNFIQFFITSFLSNYFVQLKLCQVNLQITNDCFQILSNQMTTIFLTNIISLQIPKLVAPLIKAFILKLITKKDEKLVEHPFNKIDEEIERQLKLEPYQTNEEVDGSVNDYMELVIQFSYLSLFGLAFPACYILAFVQNIVKLQVDKYNFFNYSRRPFPQGAATIGNWLIIFEMISFLAIFTNAGLIVFTSEIIKENQVQVFSTLLIVFLTLKYIIRFLVPDEPAEALLLNKRHEFVVEKAVKGFQTESNARYLMQNVNRRIGGPKQIISSEEED